MRNVALILVLTLSWGQCFSQKIEKDIALGENYSAFIEEAVGVYENEELTAYIKSVGDRLTAQMQDPLFDYRYTILATAEPNAFSIPGGHLYITTGMFPFLESEDELACIMAHEIIHAEERHVIKSNRRGVIPGILQIPGAIIGAIIDEDLGNAINAPFREIGALTHASYNRRQETRADVEGVKIAVKAGYDPEALISILTRLGKYDEISSGEPETTDRYAGHPITVERVAKIEKAKEKTEKALKPALASDFFQKFDGALVGSDPKRGVFVEETYVNPTDSFKLVFPKGWEGGFVKNVVYSVNEEKGEYMRVIFRESSDDPTKAAKEFLERLDPYTKQHVLGSEPVSIDGENGHIIAFREEYAGTTYYGFKTWVRHDSLLFSFLAVSQNEDLSALEEVPYTLAAPNEEVWKEIEFPRLRLVEAKENESVQALVERTKSDFPEKLTLLINQKAEGAIFEEGEKVKVVVRESLLDRSIHKNHIE